MAVAFGFDRLRRVCRMPASVLAVAALTGWAFAAAPAAAGVFNITGPTVFNPDEVDVDLNSFGPLDVTFNVAQTGTIDSIGVLADLTQYWDNIFVSLTHLGTTVVLMDFGTDNLNSGDELDAIFADGGAVLSPGSGLTTGTFAPLDALSAFNGLELSGDWTFTFFDDTVPDDGSELLASAIFGTTAESVAVPEPGSLALLGLGLIGLGAMRRPRAG